MLGLKFGDRQVFRPKWLQNDWTNKNSSNKNADSTNMLNQHVESWLNQQKYADWTGRGKPLWVDPCKISPSCLGHFEENDFCQPCLGVILFTDKAIWKNKHGIYVSRIILGLKLSIPQKLMIWLIEGGYVVGDPHQCTRYKYHQRREPSSSQCLPNIFGKWGLKVMPSSVNPESINPDDYLEVALSDN